MLDAVATLTPAGPTTPVIRVGVEWMFYPVARYYADRRPDGAIRYDVFVLPGDGLPSNAIYARQNAPPGDGVLVQEYPESGSALWRLAD